MRQWGAMESQREEQPGSSTGGGKSKITTSHTIVTYCATDLSGEAALPQTSLRTVCMICAMQARRQSSSPDHANACGQECIGHRPIGLIQPYRQMRRPLRRRAATFFSHLFRSIAGSRSARARVTKLADVRRLCCQQALDLDKFITQLVPCCCKAPMGGSPYRAALLSTPDCS